MIRRFIYLSLIIAAALSASAEMAAGEPRMQSAGASGQLQGMCSFAQNAPYNALIPGISGKKCISGCGSVALAEILSFYRYPEQAEGTGRLFIQDRDSTLALGGRIIDWNNPDMPELILRCAASIHTRLGLRNSSSSIIDLRAALICNWHYSPASTYLSNIPFERMLRIVRSEIDAGRPVVLGGGDHSFLCDGYRGDLLHFIWGWNGYCDGYRISRDMGAGASACRGRHQEGSGLCPGLPQAYFFESCSLISTWRIFPLMVLGRASANSITRGYL